MILLFLQIIIFSIIYGSGWEFNTSFLYNIKNSNKTDIGFPSDTFGFTPDSKYFYACAEGGMMSGGAVITELTQSKNIFYVLNEKSFTCKYNQENKEILFSEIKSQGSDEIISQYNFSEESGSFLKIK